MKQYIDKAVLMAEIGRRLEKISNTSAENNRHFAATLGAQHYELISLVQFIDTLEVKEEEEYQQPKHSYFDSVFHCGSEPRWKVGDILAVYHFYSDYEGEETIGEIVEVKMEDDDWAYTFKDGQVDYESVLITDEAYKKN